MTPTPRVMLLIDADNVSADVIEQAVQRTMDEYGAIHVRRAYCNAEMAVNRQAMFKRLSVRPMVNLSTGKNSTDIALAVDAIDLVIDERPDVVVLVSSDSDFAPLVIRLREKGCRVCGIGQQGKTGEETVGIYDAFIDLEHHGVKPAARTATAKKAAAKTAPAKKARATRATSATSASRAAAESSSADVAPAPAPAARKAATKTAARKTTKAAKSSQPAQPQAPKTPPTSEAAEFILAAVPALRSGKDVQLNDVAQALRAAGLLGKHGSSLKLFDKLTAEFVVMQHPDRIRWTGASAS
ncbi:NYN domain-containing protein [Variovorax sp. J22G73]|uniref:NYN domain-containing protein n=1 Tax=unclassified Variovorax TaxID=663243 RepID=UPI002575A4A2|nr:MULTISPECIES: NYN domain-containing protein [unclassified Variovorax]MDM0008746.1 NYN domain-containing protein [Variovorax sp. J22R203]MDM0101418.1 NYN domain-containing protein [Variovorax sp. J22G73]